ncbi:hypothetical protein [Nonomuraea zeae]|uniref:hypothetical protein n=1 Tax=Nonomuraea zeae TaxID=1642303 RepID=UPI001478EC69|nr:hypothetical protein [Nonomuraea zeae]
MVAGLLLPPLVAAGLWYGVGDVRLSAATQFRTSWLGLALVVAAGVGLAFLIGSRLSPVASLLGGLGFTAAGLIPTMEQTLGLRFSWSEWLPAAMRAGYEAMVYTEAMLFVGVALLVVSFFPSRWRSAGGAPPEYSPVYGSTPSPYLPHGGEDATRPMHRE